MYSEIDADQNDPFCGKVCQRYQAITRIGAMLKMNLMPTCNFNDRVRLQFANNNNMVCPYFMNRCVYVPWQGI